MVSIGRNEVSTFQYASAGNATGEIILAMGTTANDVNRTRKMFITDLKLIGGASGGVFTLYPKNFSETSMKSKGITLTIPANNFANYTWEIPYEISVVGTSGQRRDIVASCSDSGMNFVVSGYIE